MMWSRLRTCKLDSFWWSTLVSCISFMAELTDGNAVLHKEKDVF